MQGPPGTAASALAVLAVLAAAVLPLPAEAQGTRYANVVSAASHGCSPDEWTSPDLRVTVLVDGQPAIQTEKAQDQKSPLYGLLAALPSPASPVQVTIRVEEAEPGGFFWVGTSWIACDTAPGAASSYTFQWDGSQQTVVARGDAANAAEAVVVFGPDAPLAPTVKASSVQATAATLTWDPTADGHRVAWGHAGSVLATVPAGTSSYTLTGLCDNSDYRLRVVRDADPWHVGSPDLTVRTANEAPKPPKVLSASAANGSTTLGVELPTTHDVRLLEVFGGPDSSVAASGTPLHSDDRGHWFGSWQATFAGAPAYVRVRATDSGGLSSVSQPFRVGDPDQAGAWPPPASCPSGPATGSSAAVSSSTPDPASSTSTTTSSTSLSSTPSDETAEGSSSTTSSMRALQTESSSSSGSSGASTFAEDRPDFGLQGGEAAHADGDGGPSRSIPLNGGTLVLVAAVSIALFLGTVIGLALRRR